MSLFPCDLFSLEVYIYLYLQGIEYRSELLKPSQSRNWSIEVFNNFRIE
jgi:hypothetical protein